MKSRNQIKSYLEHLDKKIDAVYKEIILTENSGDSTEGLWEELESYETQASVLEWVLS